MRSFYAGFLLGCIFKNKIIHIGIKCISNGIKGYHFIKKNKQKSKSILQKITKVELVIKIKNKEYFQDLFTDYSTNKNYFSEKSVFKMVLCDQMIDYLNKNYDTLNISIETLCDLGYIETYGYSVLNKIGDIYVYITYNDLLQKFINIYQSSDTICTNDFISNVNNYNNIICATVKYNSKSEYITKYFKLFLNNKVLTLELLLLNYNKLNINLKDTELMIIDSKSNKSFKIIDKII